MSTTTCRVCKGGGPFVEHAAREMQFGTREAFGYLECQSCGSVQIAEVPSPEELARHYPEAYYSFGGSTGAAKRWLNTQRDRHAIGRWSPVGALVSRFRPDDTLPLLMKAGLRPDLRIVDVGAGRGQLLDRLSRLGFKHLLGVDPFISADLTTETGVTVKKQTVSEIEGEFDVVMFHHSLEHVPDPAADLVAATSRLRPGGVCIVRLPTTDSDGWQSHGVNWASLDPPRHLVLPSRGGMVQMAQGAGLEHVETIDDSGWLQYLNSELWSRDISPSDPGAGEVLGHDDRARFQAMADDANRRHRGDQAMFVFRVRTTANAER